MASGMMVAVLGWQLSASEDACLLRSYGRCRLLPSKAPFCHHLNDQTNPGTLQWNRFKVIASTKWKAGGSTSTQFAPTAITVLWDNALLKPSHEGSERRVTIPFISVDTDHMSHRKQLR